MGGIGACYQHMSKPHLTKRTLLRTFKASVDFIREAYSMLSVTATEARKSIYRLIDAASESHKPITIKGKRNNAILISEDDWSAIQETLFLMSIPKMRQSIKEGLELPLSSCSDELKW